MNREQAYERFERMSLQDCIDMWNESACDHYMRAYEIHETDDAQWWDWLANEIDGICDFIRYLANSGQSFNVRDKYFFYDKEIQQFFSFDTKAELIDIIQDDFFIEELINR